MSVIRMLIVAILLSGSLAQAESTASSGSGLGQGFGVNVGLGVPFITQFGVNLQATNYLGVSAGYGSLDIDVDTASAKLTMPEIMVNYYPFGGAFFIGAGVGKEDLEVTATDNGNTVKVEVEATTMIAKLGWMWGMKDKGFWFGIDASYISPTSPKTTITAPGVPTNSDEYRDAVEAADKFGEQAYPHVTLARFGWLF